MKTKSDAVGGLRVIFWGVRGSVPTPGAATAGYGGNTPCVEVRAKDEIVILDAGTGIRPLGAALKKEFGEQPIRATILLSHTHWDHIQGLPFFAPLYEAKNRFRILGRQDGFSFGDAVRGLMAPPYFPVSFDQIAGHVTVETLEALEFSIGEIAVRAHRLNHPGMALGYKLSVGGRVIAYLADNEVPADDAAVRDDVARFIRNADLVIMDCQYDVGEYGQRCGWGHGCVDEVIDLAATAKVGRFYLFHHDPTHDDARVDQILERARQIGARVNPQMHIEAAREGDTFVL